jgi:hypothetical protein
MIGMDRFRRIPGDFLTWSLGELFNRNFVRSQDPADIGDPHFPEF